MQMTYPELLLTMISLEPNNIYLRVRIATELVTDLFMLFMQIMNVTNRHTNDFCGQNSIFWGKTKLGRIKTSQG